MVDQHTDRLLCWPPGREECADAERKLQGMLVVTARYFEFSLPSARQRFDGRECRRRLCLQHNVALKR